MMVVLKGNFLYVLMEMPEKIEVLKFDSINDVDEWIKAQSLVVVKKIETKGKVLYVVNDGFSEFEILVLEV